MDMRRWLDGAGLWASLVGQSVLALCWSFPVSAILTIFSNLATVSPIDRVWPGSQHALLRAFLKLEIRMEGRSFRWRKNSARHLARRPELTLFAHAAGCNPAVMLSWAIALDGDHEDAKRGLLIRKTQFSPAELNNLVEEWLDQLRPLCQSWDRPCGRLDWIWGLSTKASAREEASRHWVGPPEGFEMLDRAMRASAERASIEASTPATSRTQKSRGRL